MSRESALCHATEVADSGRGQSHIYPACAECRLERTVFNRLAPARILDLGCGAGKPLAELQDGDEVKKCIECHKIASEVPKKLKKEWRKKKLKKAETKKLKLEYHAEALHANCKGCHKKFNKKYNRKVETVSTKALKKMMGYHWPGNVRELKAIIDLVPQVANVHVYDVGGSEVVIAPYVVDDLGAAEVVEHHLGA